jgi:hypothetical protein
MMLSFMRAGAQQSQSPMFAEVWAVMEPLWNPGFHLAVQKLLIHGKSFRMHSSPPKVSHNGLGDSARML